MARHKDTPLSAESDGASENAIQTAARLAQQPMQQGIVPDTHKDGIPFVVVPDGFNTQYFAEERYLAYPRRNTGVKTVLSMPSFKVYAERFMGKASTVIFHGDALDPFVRAIFDFSQNGAPDWESFGVQYRFASTHEWSEWKLRDGKMLGQVEFARFIEDYADNLVSVGEHTAMDFIEAARGLKATKSLEFESEQREHDGTVHMVYSETVNASSRTKSVKVPEEFGVQVVPWIGAPSVHLKARFRFNIDSGHLTMGFRFLRLDQALQPLFDESIADLATAYKLPMIQVAQ